MEIEQDVMRYDRRLEQLEPSYRKNKGFYSLFRLYLVCSLCSSHADTPHSGHNPAARESFEMYNLDNYLSNYQRTHRDNPIKKKKK